MQTALPRYWQRTQDLCAALTEKARLLGPDAKMPTVVDLCHEFRASARTLISASRIGNNGMFFTVCARSGFSFRLRYSRRRYGH